MKKLKTTTATRATHPTATTAQSQGRSVTEEDDEESLSVVPSSSSLAAAIRRSAGVSTGKSIGKST